MWVELLTMLAIIFWVVLICACCFNDPDIASCMCSCGITEILGLSSAIGSPAEKTRVSEAVVPPLTNFKQLDDAV